MAVEPLLAEGIGNALKTRLVAGLNCPIKLAADSVNQRLLSGPTVMLLDPLLAIGIGNDVKTRVVGLKSHKGVGIGRDEPEAGVGTGDDVGGPAIG